MGDAFYQWIDLIWLPIGWFAVKEKHRVITIAFLATCMLSLRTQIEFMESLGFEDGIIQLMSTPLFSRGLIVYSIVTAVFLTLAHYSPNTRNIVFLGVAIIIYIFAFCISTVAMML